MFILLRFDFLLLQPFKHLPDYCCYIVHSQVYGLKFREAFRAIRLLVCVAVFHLMTQLYIGTIIKSRWNDAQIYWYKYVKDIQWYQYTTLFLLLTQNYISANIYIIKKEGERMAVSDAQKKANKKYFDNNYKQVKLSMPIKEAEELEEHCKRFQYTKAGFIRDAIKEKIERDISNNMR